MAELDRFRHHAFEEVSSTNATALAAARDGEGGGLWITARRQTAGRGRRGRSWSSAEGNLYSSLMLIDPGPIALLHSLPLVAAVAAQQAVAAALPYGVEARVKWPNDILIEGRKAVGILLESEGLPDGRRAVVIGIGINVAEAPDHGLYPITSIREMGGTLSADEVFAHLFRAMAEGLALWDEGRGLAGIVAAWRQRAAGIGGRITVNLPNGSLSGVFEDIDEAGQLILRDEGGQRRLISVGDVFFG
ncbi:biotin--[acetyl-CoA-carboxylase] ligase [Rhizobium rhizosphaerae]|uniref:biotin--[biotin carboxyl-carrier protein] ligase n=1 Tax=Xaviernesmea rhizosphaerae TaxID=1672749 RepID=A0ABX3PC34_9HYPH|nr:biotin--[acetyl-CoA-carboxylase] ligase [Xaviernesmea rhizosphaerae]OQP85583.1 biotin--[acetyl-CoA-carboxylase] ligase [Xaviernesmea rhizosphaerae]